MRDPALRDEHVGPLRRLRPRVRRGTRAVRACSPGPPAWPARRYLRLLAEVPRFHRDGPRAARWSSGDLAHAGRVPRRGRFSRLLPHHFVDPAGRLRSGRAAPDAGRYPARYLFAFLPTTGCSPSPAPRSGGPWSAAQPRLRREDRQEPHRRPHLHPGPRAAPHGRGGVELATTPTASHRFDAAVVATHPDQALRLLADPTAGERRGARRVPVLRATRPCCTPTPRCCPGAARASLVELPDARLHGATPTAVEVSYDMNRLQRLDDPRPLPGHPERRRPHPRRARDRPGWSTSTRSTPPSRSPPRRGCPRSNDGVHRLRRRLPRLGLPRGRLPLRRARRRGLGVRLVTRRAVRRRRRSPTSAPPGRATRSSYRMLPGWSTSTDCPLPALRRWPASTPRPLRRPAPTTGERRRLPRRHGIDRAAGS